jgi:hypothetical protein
MSRRLVAMPRFPNGNWPQPLSRAIELRDEWLKYDSISID